MDVVALAPPSVVSSWGVAVLRRLLEQCFGPVRVVTLGAADPFPEAEDAGPRLVILEHGNGPALAGVPLWPTPAIAFLDDPLQAVQSRRAGSDAMPLVILRQVTADRVGLLALLRRRSVLVIGRDRQDDARAALIAMVEHLHAATQDPALAALRETGEAAATAPVPLELALRSLVPDFVARDALSDLFAPEEVDTIRTVVGSLDAGLDGRALEAVWTRPCFISGDEHVPLTNPAAEVAGLARILFYGPYMHLPAARYRARVTVAFSSNLFASSFEIIALDVTTHAWLGRVRVKPQRGGIYAFNFIVEVLDGSHPVEIHFKTEQGAIEGRVALAQVEFHEEPVG